MTDGYFLLARSLASPEHDLHPQRTGEPACRFAAWVDLIGMARWRDGGGLERGQMAHSERFLSARWNRPRSWVSRFLAELEAENRISREPQEGREPGHITISNYETYQDPRTANRSTPPSEPRTGPQTEPQANRKQVHKNPRGTTTYAETRTTSEPQTGPQVDPRTGPKKKEERSTTTSTTGGMARGNGKTPPPAQLEMDAGRYLYPDAFEDAWSRYPDREGGNPKKAAYRAWRARVNDGMSPGKLSAAVRRYRDHCEAEGKDGTRYVLQAATFFGPDEHWMEWAKEPPRPSAGSPFKGDGFTVDEDDMERLYGR